MYILRLRDPQNNTVQSIEIEDDKVLAVMQIANAKKIWHNKQSNEFYNLAYFIDCKKKYEPKTHVLQLPKDEYIDPVQRKKNLKRFREMKKKLFGK